MDQANISPATTSPTPLYVPPYILAGLRTRAVSFASKFQEQYVRVCKRTGKKNIRCFPCCSPSGHIQDGFCGQPVVAELSFDLPHVSNDLFLNSTDGRNLIKALKPQLHCVGEIDIKDAPLRYTKGNVVSKDVVCIAGTQESLIRTKANHNLPLFKAEIVADKQASESELKYNLLFNLANDPWHYPWHPVRQSTKVNHEFRIYIFMDKETAQTPMGENDIQAAYHNNNKSSNNRTENNVECISVITSSSFFILTSRKSILAKKGLLKEPPGPVNDIDISKMVDDEKESAQGDSDENEDIDDEPDEAIGNANQRKNAKRKRENMKKEERQKRKTKDTNASEPSVSSAASPNESIDEEKMASISPNPGSQRKIECFYRLMETFVYGQGNPQIKSNEKIISDYAEDPMQRENEKFSLSSIQEFSSILLGEFFSGERADFFNIFSQQEIYFDDPPPLNSSSFSSSASGPRRLTSNNSFLAVQMMEENSAIGKSATFTQNLRAFLARDLADYLTNDRSFLDSVSAFFRNLRSTVMKDGENVDVLFQKFTSIVHEHIDGFLQSRNITFEQLESQLSLIPKNRSREGNESIPDTRRNAQMTSLRSEFLQRLQKRSAPDKFTAGISLPVPKKYDVEGTWVYIGEDNIENEAVQNLNRLGFPGFLLKLFRKASMRTHLNINRDWLLWEGSEKLVHNASSLYALDGKVHTWMVPNAVPLAMPVRNANYIAYIDERKGCIFLDQFGTILHDPTKELHWKKEIKLSEDGVELFVKGTIECYNLLNGTVEVLGTMMNPFLRVWREGDTKQLLLKGMAM